MFHGLGMTLAPDDGGVVYDDQYDGSVPDSVAKYGGDPSTYYNNLPPDGGGGGDPPQSDSGFTPIYNSPLTPPLDMSVGTLPVVAAPGIPSWLLIGGGLLLLVGFLSPSKGERSWD